MTVRANPIDQLVGRRVRVLRVARGLSQTALASRLGLTFQQVQKYEKGTNRMSASRLHQIATVLNVDVAGLFTDAFDPEASNRIGENGDAPRRIDLLIVHKLSQLPAGQLKTLLVSLIFALVSRPPVGGDSIASLQS